MDEKLKHFNLEIGLFLKEIKSCIADDNEINDETVKLIAETMSSMDKLLCRAKFHESLPDNENDFFFDLNNEHFQFRRHIVCCLCHDHIPMSRHDYEAHVEKKTHKEKESIKSKVSTESDNKCETNAIAVEPTLILNKSDKQPINDKSVISSVKVKANNLTDAQLKSLVSDDSLFKRIANEAKILETRTSHRCLNEARILEVLKHYLQIFDSTLNIIPFGSTLYGFGGPNTNFSILIDAANSEHASADIIPLFEKFIKVSDMSNQFSDITRIEADRTLSTHLRMVHTTSEIGCLLLADNIELTNSSKIIQDFITIRPICRHLIFYVRAWQNIINEMAVQKYGTIAFHFNTYIISVLVIFYLQLDYKLQVIDEIKISLSNSKAIEDAKNALPKELNGLRDLLYNFFYCFGDRYQQWNHVISCYIGRWQERRIQAKQKHFKPNQKRLRDGIKRCEINWKKCSMYVQDLVQSHVNIAAEVTEKETANFQELCSLFASQLRTSTM